jgi:hypothetical protein
MVIVPARPDRPGLLATEKVTVPLPIPQQVAVTVIQLALLTDCQTHRSSVITSSSRVSQGYLLSYLRLLVEVVIDHSFLQFDLRANVRTLRALPFRNRVAATVRHPDVKPVKGQGSWEIAHPDGAEISPVADPQLCHGVIRLRHPDVSPVKGQG